MPTLRRAEFCATKFRYFSLWDNLRSGVWDLGVGSLLWHVRLEEIQFLLGERPRYWSKILGDEKLKREVSSPPSFHHRILLCVPSLISKESERSEERCRSAINRIFTRASTFGKIDQCRASSGWSIEAEHPVRLHASSKTSNLYCLVMKIYYLCSSDEFWTHTHCRLDLPHI